MTLCALVILLQTLTIVIMVALSASCVHEEVMNDQKSYLQTEIKFQKSFKATNGFEALRGAYRNHLNSEEERMVNSKF